MDDLIRFTSNPTLSSQALDWGAQIGGGRAEHRVNFRYPAEELWRAARQAGSSTKWNPPVGNQLSSPSTVVRHPFTFLSLGKPCRTQLDSRSHVFARIHPRDTLAPFLSSFIDLLLWPSMAASPLSNNAGLTSSSKLSPTSFSKSSYSLPHPKEEKKASHPSITSHASIMHDDNRQPKRIDTLDLKHKLNTALGFHANRYWSTLAEFMKGKIDRIEFEEEAMKCLKPPYSKCTYIGGRAVCLTPLALLLCISPSAQLACFGFALQCIRRCPRAFHR